jgi:hypothetical protein
MTGDGSLAPSTGCRMANCRSTGSNIHVIYVDHAVTNKDAL